MAGVDSNGFLSLSSFSSPGAFDNAKKWDWSGLTNRRSPPSLSQDSACRHALLLLLLCCRPPPQGGKAGWRKRALSKGIKAHPQPTRTPYLVRGTKVCCSVRAFWNPSAGNILIVHSCHPPPRPRLLKAGTRTQEAKYGRPQEKPPLNQKTRTMRIRGPLDSCSPFAGEHVKRHA